MQLKPQHLESGTEGSLELLYQSAFHKYPYVHVHKPHHHTHTFLSSFFSLSSSPQEIKILCCGGIRFAYMTKLEHTRCSTTDRTSGLLTMPTAPFCLSTLSNYSPFFLYTGFRWFSVTQIESSVPIGLGLCITFTAAMSKNDLSWV